MSHAFVPTQCGTFPTTQWTVVNALKMATPEARKALLADFLERYSPAFRLHLIHGRGITHPQDLEDTLQGFITDKLIAKNILDYVSQGGGRLRDYFRKCLDHYVYSHHRGKSAVAWDRRVSWDDLGRDSVDTSETVSSFDVAWARTVLTEASRRTQNQFRSGQRPHVWEVFDLCVVRPLFTDQEAVPYAELAQRLGLTVKDVQNRRVTALRAFSKHLKEVIAEYVGQDAAAIKLEIVELSRVLRHQSLRGRSA